MKKVLLLIILIIVFSFNSIMANAYIYTNNSHIVTLKEISFFDNYNHYGIWTYDVKINGIKIKIGQSIKTNSYSNPYARIEITQNYSYLNSDLIHRYLYHGDNRFYLFVSEKYGRYNRYTMIKVVINVK
jgi:hypothetical protein